MGGVSLVSGAVVEFPPTAELGLEEATVAGSQMEAQERGFRSAGAGGDGARWCDWYGWRQDGFINTGSTR